MAGPGTMTIYNCGTDFNREKSDLIADLYARTHGAENRDKMITEGVGSHPQGDQKQSVAKTPGTIRWDDKRGIGKSGTTGTQVLKGTVSGSGWEQNVDRVMRVLEAIEAGNGSPPQTINMAGWSRGAVTCHMLANAIYQKWQQRIALNIFAIDPVPGPGNFDDPAKTTLPPSVKRYIALFALDEERRIMKPLTYNPPRGCEAQCIVMPGAHETMVKASSEVGYLTRDLAESFLLKSGTQLSPVNPLTTPAKLEYYATVRGSRDAYKRKGKQANSPMMWVAGAATCRAGSLDRQLDSKVDAGKDFFINTHHEALFNNTYPALYALLFERSIRLSGMTTETGQRLNQQLTLLQRQSPVTSDLLRGLQILPN